MTLKEQIMKLQTYKMYEGEESVYVERDDVLKALEQQLRDCKTCKHSDNGKCAYTEECHECMWSSKYEQELCDDAISRQAVMDIIDFEDKWLHDANGHNANTKIAFSGLRSKVKALTSVTPEESEDCISRKEAIKEFQVYREYSSNMTNIDWVDRIENVLTYLPSVTPKTGSEE